MRQRRRAQPADLDALTTMLSEVGRSGSTSTAAKASLTPTRWLEHERRVISVDPQICHRRSTLGRVTACIYIGRWHKLLVLKSGPNTRIDFENYVIATVLRLTILELRIFRRYFAPPERITENMGSSGLSSGAAPSVHTSYPI